MPSQGHIATAEPNAIDLSPAEDRNAIESITDATTIDQARGAEDTDFNAAEMQNLVDNLVTDIRVAAGEIEDDLNTSRQSHAQQFPLILDKRVQTTLAVRASLYWIACVTYFAVVLFFTQIMYNPKVALGDHIRSYLLDMIQWVPAILLLLPLVIYDMLRVSQRILVPVEEVRQGLSVLATGKVPDPIPCSEEEFNHSLMQTYNEIRDSVIAETVASAVESRFLDSALDG